MRVGDYWKALLRKIKINTNVKPDEFEVFNGSVIFWFYSAAKVKDVVEGLRQNNIPYQVEWDKEDGIMGISLKRELLS